MLLEMWFVDGLLSLPRSVIDELAPTQKSRKDSGSSRGRELWVNQGQVRAWLHGGGRMGAGGRGALNASLVMGSYGVSLNKESDRRKWFLRRQSRTVAIKLGSYIRV